MHRTIIAGALALTAVSSTLATDRFQFRQEFGPVTSQRHTAAGPPTDLLGLYFVHGPAELELRESANGVTNPYYQESTLQGEMPLYEGDDRGAAGILAQIESLSYELGPVSAGASDGGIVHRDVAARNLVMQTDFGTFSTLDGAEFLFGSDAPADYFATGQVTWVTIDTITLYLDGDESSSEFFVFNGTWFTDTIVPAPGAAALFGLGALGANRRRR